VHLAAPLPAESPTQKPAAQAVDVDDHESLGFLHLCYGMGLPTQLLSQKRFDEHLHPPSFGAATTALQELDESGIPAFHFTRKSLHERHFNFNYTFGIGTR
jgi:hypothetical protein